MAPRVRFAPSPTGYLHVGNARTALYNALIARREGGTFLLRLDDTDRERSEERFAEAIAEDLAWLGIPPDETVRQSDRLDRYREAFEGLLARGLVYRAYETPEELDRRRRLQRARGLPPVYDRAALALTADDRARLEAEGRRPHYRFRLPVEPGAAGPEARVTWRDLCRGETTVNLAAVSDPVIMRADGSWLYMFPSVVDDIDMGITHVVRGEDHVTNTGVQVAIFRALGAEPPAFGHHNLVAGPDGEPLSKRSGSLSLRSLRQAGYEPGAVASLAALTGTALPVEAVASADALGERLDLSAVSRSPARIEPAELDGLNAILVHALSHEDVAGRLAALGVGGGAAFWGAVRANVSRVPEAADWWRVVTGPPPGGALADPDDAPFLAEALAVLPPEPWSDETFRAWTAAVRERTGRKGKALFMPLRRALTGRASGPELGPLLPLIGRERAAGRLAAAAAGCNRTGWLAPGG